MPIKSTNAKANVVLRMNRPSPTRDILTRKSSERCDLGNVGIENTQPGIIAAGPRGVPDATLFGNADFRHVRSLRSRKIGECFRLRIEMDDASALPGIGKPDSPVIGLEIIRLGNLVRNFPFGELAGG